MSTAAMRPQLEIRPAREEDAAPLCELFNEAVQDHMETFDSEPRAVEDQRMLIAVTENDPKLLAENRDGLLLCRATGWHEVGRHSAHARLNDGLHDVIVVEYLISSGPASRA
jgi:L-amino acid N-acyltransferase YncA